MPMSRTELKKLLRARGWDRYIPPPGNGHHEIEIIFGYYLKGIGIKTILGFRQDLTRHYFTAELGRELVTFLHRQLRNAINEAQTKPAEEREHHSGRLRQLLSYGISEIAIRTLIKGSTFDGTEKERAKLLKRLNTVAWKLDSLKEVLQQSRFGTFPGQQHFHAWWTVLGRKIFLLIKPQRHLENGGRA